MAKVSVIVAVYNVEKYLNKCVDSLLAQTLSDIEILLVDDGSTDGSGRICDDYAGKDNRVRVIHKENGGLSDARNRGIEEALAEYIGFIDGDDYVDEDMFEVLYQNLLKEEADVSVCGLYHCYTNDTRTSADTTGYYVTDAKEIIRMVLDSSKISVNAVNKLYRKQLFDHIRFPKGKRSEDAHIMIRLLDQVKTAVVTMAPKYYYIHREGSITTQKYSAADLSVIEAYTNNLKFVREHYPELMPEARFRYFWSHFYVLDKMMFTENMDKKGKNTEKKIIQRLRRHCREILSNPCVGRGRKIAMIALMIHPCFYKLCVDIYSKKRRQLFG